MDKPVLMNEEPIHYDFGECVLYFHATTYAYGDQPKAIFATPIDDDSDGDYQEDYATVTVNLVDYGVVLDEGQVVLNHDLPWDFKQLFIDNFCDPNDIQDVQYGMATSQIVRLKDTSFWED